MDFSCLIRFILVIFIIIILFGTEVLYAESSHKDDSSIKISTSKTSVEITPSSTTTSIITSIIPSTSSNPSNIPNTSVPFEPTTAARAISGAVKLPIILVCVFGSALVSVAIVVFFYYRVKKRRNRFRNRCPVPLSNCHLQEENLAYVNKDEDEETNTRYKPFEVKNYDTYMCCSERALSKNYSSNFDSGFQNLSLERSDVDADLHTTSKTVKKVITAKHGGVLERQYAKLDIGADCLEEDTAITMMNIEKYPPFQELSDLKLLDNEPLVIEFLPDGLRFKECAKMTAVLPENDPKLDLCVLHGSYDSGKERVVWEIVNDEAQVKRKDDGTVTMDIKGFSFYSFFLARRGKLSMILSHLNHSFNCHAVALYRRVPTMPGFRIAVVLLSEFVKKKNSQVSCMTMKSEENPLSYKIGDMSAEKRIDTQRRYEICLDFNEGANTDQKVMIKIREDQLSSRGMVLDAELPEIMKDFPTSGKISIFEVYRQRRTIIWELCIVESSEETLTQEVLPECSKENEVERRQGLSSSSINRLSHIIGVDWDSLAGLMDIPYNVREEIKTDNANYPDISSKAKAILVYINKHVKSPRNKLAKYSDEIQRKDLTNAIKSKNENTSEDDNGESEDENTEDADDHGVVLRDTPLSSREMSRISRMVVDWESLAGLMDLPHATTHDIKVNHHLYPDLKSKTEKVLDIFNRSNSYCREKLVDCFKELRLDDMVDKIKYGLLRY